MPRLGLATIDISALGGSGDTVTTIDDFVFESFSAGQMHPMLTTSRTNLVRNSNFTTDSIWSKTNATINTTTNKGTITVTSGGFSALSQGVTFEVGKTYTVSAVVNGEAGKEMRFQDNGNNTGGLTTGNATITMTGSDQNVEITWVANSNSTEFVIARNTNSGNYSFDISKVQVEQDGFASAFIPTAGSTVTVPTTLNDTSEVWDFDGTDIMIAEDPEDEGFWEEGSNLVLNHSYEELGDNLVVNGTFETPVNNNQWFNFGTPTTAERTTALAYEGNHSYHIVGNSTNDGTQAAAVQFAGDYTVGDVVKINAYVYPITAFNNQIKTGVAGSSRGITSGYTVVLNQWNKIEYYATITDTTVNYITFLIMGDGKDGEFYLDNVSAEIVDPNDRWTLTSGWSIEDGIASCDGTNSALLFQSLSGTTTGDTFEVTYTISGYVSGSVFVGFGSGLAQPSGTTRNANGTYTEILTKTGVSTSFGFKSVSFVGSVDNVTVREYAIKPKDI